ncbi:MAG: hypothetical protein ACOZD0_14165 [Pseudomonadota bacterium]
MKRAMWIVWPSFLVAGLLEAVVFAVIDPVDLLHLLEAGWTATALYSVAFFVFWAVVAGASALSLWLAGAFAQPAGQTPATPVAGAAHIA